MSKCFLFIFPRLTQKIITNILLKSSKDMVIQMVVQMVVQMVIQMVVQMIQMIQLLALKKKHGDTNVGTNGVTNDTNVGMNGGTNTSFVLGSALYIVFIAIK